VALTHRIGIIAFSVVSFSVVACGRTTPLDQDTSRERLLPGDAAVDCVENADCGEEEVCLDNTCVYFGQCLEDFHCATLGGCVNNECIGELPLSPEGESVPLLCEINADCPPRHYCVEQACKIGVECVTHGHCETGKACLWHLCIDAR
jgi:hypothetical protein